MDVTNIVADANYYQKTVRVSFTPTDVLQGYKYILYRAAVRDMRRDATTGILKDQASYEVVSEPATTTYLYDYNLRALDPGTSVFYKVGVLNGSDVLQATYPDVGVPVALPSDAIVERLIGIENTIREHGSRGWYLEKLHTGERCDCVDPVTMQRLRGQCDHCYGTTFVGGFFPPVPVHFTVIPPDSFKYRSLTGNLRDGEGLIMLAATTHFKRGSILIEPDRDVWRIDRIAQEKKYHKVPYRFILNCMRVTGQAPFSMIAEAANREDFDQYPEDPYVIQTGRYTGSQAQTLLDFFS